jgi:hypothetical protein
MLRIQFSAWPANLDFSMHGALYHVMARDKPPEPNLVSGMKWLLSAYSQGWNRAGMCFRGATRRFPSTLRILRAMGHPGSVSRSVSDGRADNTMLKSIKNIEKMLIRVI